MSKPQRDTRFLRRTFTSLSGILIWAAHFGLVYGVQHVACREGAGEAGYVKPVIYLATVLAAALMGLVAAKARNWLAPDDPAMPGVSIFLRAVTHILLVLSLFGVLATTASAILLPTCAALR